MLAVPWWIWAILAALIGVAELHAPGGYLIWIALGAAVTAAVDAASGLSITAQIGVFGVSSAVSCIGGYFVYRKLNHPRLNNTVLNERNLLTIGARGTVSAPFVSGRGKVRLGDTVWLAEGPDLSEGTAIVVTSVRGTWVIVRPVEPAAVAAGATSQEKARSDQPGI